MDRRAILLHQDHPALLRARRKRLGWSKREYGLYAQHRGRVEGIHGEAKTWHGLVRAVRRGLATMQIQACLIAAVINLKRRQPPSAPSRSPSSTPESARSASSAPPTRI